MGLGFLGIRDLLSFLRFEGEDASGTPNPLAGHVDKLYGTGASLSGRVIREYVYEGWNQDAATAASFDAVHTHTGSGRLLFNQRFAQVGRYPRQHEEHQWPAEYYPFTFAAAPDPFTERVDGLWKRPETDPLVIHLHTEGDYWNRHVSLTHTDPRAPAKSSCQQRRACTISPARPTWRVPSTTRSGSASSRRAACPLHPTAAPARPHG